MVAFEYIRSPEFEALLICNPTSYLQGLITIPDPIRIGRSNLQHKALRTTLGFKNGLWQSREAGRVAYVSCTLVTLVTLRVGACARTSAEKGLHIDSLAVFDSPKDSKDCWQAMSIHDIVTLVLCCY